MSLTRLAAALTRFTVRWTPSAFSIACVLTLVTVAAGMLWGEAGPSAVLRHWGDGFWTLLSFGMQMTLIVFAGHMVATSRPVSRGLRWLAGLPWSPTSAVVCLALAAMVIAWGHWGLGLVASAVLVGHVARAQPEADYRLLVAVSYFGLGATWHAGPSGSVPLLLATPHNFLIERGVLADVVPMSETLLMSFNLQFTAVAAVLLCGLAALLHPPVSQRVTARSLGLDRDPAADEPATPDVAAVSAGADGRPSPAQRLERSPVLCLALAGLAGWWLVQHVARGGRLTLDVVNFAMLALGIALHLRPQAVVAAAREAVRPVHGIVLQFPLYAGMFGIISKTALSAKLTRAFLAVASPRTFPLITFWYSGLLNYFVPSGGSKWAIEAPYLLAAGERLGVSVPRVAMAYAYGDMCTNLIQPFWAIPLLSVAGLEFKEILGFEVLAFLLYTSVASVALLTLF